MKSEEVQYELDAEKNVEICNKKNFCSGSADCIGFQFFQGVTRHRVKDMLLT